MVFQRAIHRQRPALDLRSQIGHAYTTGKVGLELEFEGNSFQKQDLPKQWSHHVDHSLRGEDNAEYVLRRPLEFDQIPGALDDLWAMMDKHGTVLSESNRTSVHVHLNCQDFHLNRLTSFIALYAIVEDILTQWCGDHRVGNLFCLRVRDAPATLTALTNFIKSDCAHSLPETLHYAAMNANALLKFGSLEFRTLRGVNDKQTVLDWVRILQRLYELSAEFPDPREICAQLSMHGPLEFFSNTLGAMAVTVRQGVDYTDEQIRDMMYEGVRLVQGLCYCRDWSQFKKLELREDPFGRDAKKIAKRVAQMTTEPVAPSVTTASQIQELAAYAQAATSFENFIVVGNEEEDDEYIDVDEFFDDEESPLGN